MTTVTPLDLDDLVALAGACNVAHAPDAKDLAALHAQLASSLYHLQPAAYPVPPPPPPAECAFAPASTPTASGMYRPWTSPVAEYPPHPWASAGGASTAHLAPGGFGSSGGGASFDTDDDEMAVDVPMGGPVHHHSTHAVGVPLVRGNAAGGGGRPGTPVLPSNQQNQYHHTGSSSSNSTYFVHPHVANASFPGSGSAIAPVMADVASESTTFATSDPFYIDLQQKQRQQKSRTLHATPFRLGPHNAAVGGGGAPAPAAAAVAAAPPASVQYAPLLRQNYHHASADEYTTSAFLRPRC